MWIKIQVWMKIWKWSIELSTRAVFWIPRTYTVDNTKNKMLSFIHLMASTPTHCLDTDGKEADTMHGMLGPGTLCPCLPTNIQHKQACLKVRQQWVILTNLFLRSSGVRFLPAGFNPEPRTQLASCGAAGQEGGVLSAHAAHLAVTIGVIAENGDSRDCSVGKWSWQSWYGVRLAERYW